MILKLVCFVIGGEGCRGAVNIDGHYGFLWLLLHS